MKVKSFKNARLIPWALAALALLAFAVLSQAPPFAGSSTYAFKSNASSWQAGPFVKTTGSTPANDNDTQHVIGRHGLADATSGNMRFQSKGGSSRSGLYTQVHSTSNDIEHIAANGYKLSNNLITTDFNAATGLGTGGTEITQPTMPGSNTLPGDINGFGALPQGTGISDDPILDHATDNFDGDSTPGGINNGGSHNGGGDNVGGHNGSGSVSVPAPGGLATTLFFGLGLVLIGFGIRRRQSGKQDDGSLTTA